ncbi:family 78 glycoside hydrolase catalytic domain [Flavobacterium sp.]|uniref:family 78 glycoside hydrolase catalytic domain n=1 Tax=Flavobacterium sp. TaxID=239 RepID=UPI00286DC580|nr:family 78 glycoside hydrolase catalytic domain [Flavobacterium sp.]
MKIINVVKVFIIGSILTLVSISSSYSQQISTISIDETLLNNEINPIGIDDVQPNFSWKLKSAARKKYQKAYQIVVWVENTTDTCWNSGKVRSDNTIQIKYAGKPLKTVHNYNWKVRIWDNDGKRSSWSKESHFSMGLFSESDWKAKWISSPDSFYSPVFEKKFNVDKVADFANVFVNCQGYFELYINGKKVGKDVLSPAVSDFQSENYYITYDIRDYLKIGENTINLWTGRGWYSKGLPSVTHHSPVFRLQAHLSSKQSSTVIVSDTTWTTSNSNISQIGKWRWNNMGGEIIDYRIIMTDFNSNKTQKNVIQIANPKAITKSQICRPNVISDTILVKNISQIDEDVWLVDFGKNFTGWMKMEIKNKKEGDTIDFIYSDFCNKKPGKISKYKWDFGNNYINQRDAYISSKAESGTFCPKFNFHAFRYVIIQGLKYEPKVQDIKGYMIESNLTEAGKFSSSDEDLNAIYELNRFTFRCLDIGGYYVDCPHRERLGYGDGQVAVETGIYSFDLANFYKKWSLNWKAAQKDDGEIPNTAPSPYGAGGGPGWGGTGVVLPWKIYKYYGDIKLLSDSYTSMVHYVDFLETKSKDGILIHYGDEKWGFIGDWVPPGKGMDSNDKVGKFEKEVFNNCYKIYLYNILAECANVLGKPNDSKKYKRQSEMLQNKIHETYYNKEKGIYANGEQAYLSFPLLMNVPVKDEIDRVMANLENTIKITDNGHLNTGMLGTYFMLQYLTNIGRSDLVYLMMKQKTYPGWGYMISQGANTAWEQWNGYWSNIHSCFTSGGGWFYTGLAGIRQTEKSVAFKHLLIVPQLTDIINEQKTEFNSPYGKVVVSWNHDADKNLQMEIEIPVNTNAAIILPVLDNQIVFESGKKIRVNDDVKILSKESGKLRLLVESGKYVFEIRNN